MMKKTCLLVLLFYIANNFIYSQNQYFNYSSLNFQNGVAFNNNKKFTGEVLKKSYDNKYTEYPYKNGLLHGKFRDFNEIFLYDKGILLEYIYKHADGSTLIHIDNNSGDKLITRIKVGVWFDNQQNDTVFLSRKMLESEYLEFKFGVVLYLKNGKNEFLELNHFKFIECRINALFGQIHWEEKLFDYKFPTKFFNDRMNFLYFSQTQVKLPNDDIYMFRLHEQKIFFIYEK